MKVPKERRLRKPKPIEKPEKVLPDNSSELPDWVKEFIKTSVPKIDKSIELPLNQTLMSNEVFSLSTGSFVEEDQGKSDLISYPEEKFEVMGKNRNSFNRNNSSFFLF